MDCTRQFIQFGIYILGLFNVLRFSYIIQTGRGQGPEAEAETEARALRSRPRPRPISWRRGQGWGQR